jgi:hypothetical protein
VNVYRGPEAKPKTVRGGVPAVAEKGVPLCER